MCVVYFDTISSECFYFIRSTAVHCFLFSFSISPSIAVKLKSRKKINNIQELFIQNSFPVEKRGKFEYYKHQFIIIGLLNSN